VPTRGKTLAAAVQPRGELVRYDARTAQYVPYLSGIFASELSFSADGQWVTYVAYPDNTLWRCRADGSDRQQLTYAPAEAHLPRWSPDGKQIAFISKRNGRWKIFLLSVADGTAKELLPQDNYDEADPVFSADSTKLAFGPVESVREIEVVDLKTAEMKPVSGSKGLFSPRWSPDGRYLAALTQDSLGLRFFDFGRSKWSEPVVEQGVIGFPSWSRDSKYLYFDERGEEPAFRRIRIGAEASEPLFSLKELPQFSASMVGNWSGLAPDGSVLFTRDISTEEIYALDIEWP